jgi:two-component system NtrC family sensor kinase
MNQFERKHAEEALSESEISCRTLLENLPVIVYRVLLQENHRMQIFNNMVQPMTGYAAEELSSGEVHSLDPLIVPEDRGRVISEVKRAVETGEPFEVEYRLQLKNGKLRNFLERGRPVRGQDGSPSHIDGIILDITERKRSDEKLRKAGKLEDIGKLVGGIAHEVRNPLNAIMVLSDALAKDLGHNPEYEPFLTHIHAQVDRLAVLMRDLLDLGKPIEQFDMQRISLIETCSRAVDIWRHDGQKRTQEIDLVPPPGAAVQVVGDARRLHQVFVNLLDNASQHSTEDGVIRLVIDVPEEGMCRIQVVDQGSGIPQEMLGRVFEPFFFTRKGGTGLGMSIVKHIVEAHQGTVKISNNDPPPGCTVELRLPLAEKERS